MAAEHFTGRLPRLLQESDLPRELRAAIVDFVAAENRLNRGFLPYKKWKGEGSEATEAARAKMFAERVNPPANLDLLAILEFTEAPMITAEAALDRWEKDGQDESLDELILRIREATEALQQKNAELGLREE